MSARQVMFDIMKIMANPTHALDHPLEPAYDHDPWPTVRLAVASMMLRALRLDELEAKGAVMEPTYGIWVDATEERANERALAGDEPDMIVRTAGHTTGSTAREIVEQLGNAVFREVKQKFRAVGV